MESLQDTNITMDNVALLDFDVKGGVSDVAGVYDSLYSNLKERM